MQQDAGGEKDAEPPVLVEIRSALRHRLFAKDRASQIVRCMLCFEV